MRHQRHAYATFAALLYCTALQPAFHRARVKHRAATDDELWADTSGDDIDLAGLDDVDALDRYKRRCAACAQVCEERDMAPSKVCVVAARIGPQVVFRCGAAACVVHCAPVGARRVHERPQRVTNEQQVQCCSSCYIEASVPH